MSPELNGPDERGFRRIVDSLGGPWVWVVVALFVVVALSVRFIVQPSTSTTTDTTVAATPSTLGPVSTTTLPPTTEAPPTTHVTPAPTTPAPTTALEDSGVWTMPEVTGRSLSDAKDEIDSVTDGTDVSVSVTDLSGDDRHPIIHQNWTVCGQSPLPGQKFTVESGVILDVVKKNEDCPDNGA